VFGPRWPQAAARAAGLARIGRVIVGHGGAVRGDIVGRHETRVGEGSHEEHGDAQQQRPGACVPGHTVFEAQITSANVSLGSTLKRCYPPWHAAQAACLADIARDEEQDLAVHQACSKRDVHLCIARPEWL